MGQKFLYKPPKSNLKLGLICLGVSAVLISIVILLPLNDFTFYMAILGGILFQGGLGILLTQLDYTHPRYVVLGSFEIQVPQVIKKQPSSYLVSAIYSPLQHQCLL